MPSCTLANFSEKSCCWETLVLQPVKEFPVFYGIPVVQYNVHSSPPSEFCSQSRNFVSSLIWRSEDLPATITTCTGGCRVSILHFWWWALDARNMWRNSAVVIKSTSCWITSVFCLMFLSPDNSSPIVLYKCLLIFVLNHSCQFLQPRVSLWTKELFMFVYLAPFSGHSKSSSGLLYLCSINTVTGAWWYLFLLFVRHKSVLICGRSNAWLAAKEEGGAMRNKA